MEKIKYIIIFVFVFFISISSALADETDYTAMGKTMRYVNVAETYNGDGTSWSSASGDSQPGAMNAIPSSPTRDYIYFIADGTYSSPILGTTASGSLYCYIIKATEDDHGTDTGWNSSYGDGQAVLGSRLTLNTAYWIVDGNGTHTSPSNTTSDYGFKINSARYSDFDGFIDGNANYLIIRYLHLYNAYHSENSPDDACNGSDTFNATRAVKWPGSYRKLQYCYIQNSGKDGLQADTGSNFLYEYNYLERLGKLVPCGSGARDDHGQAIRFWSNSNVIIRHNIIKGLEGQAIVCLGGYGNMTDIRVYGNLFWSDGTNSYGANSSSRWVGDGWTDGDNNGIYVYNNSFIDITQNYSGFYFVESGSNQYVYNNLWYNCNNWANVNSGTFDYNAYGLCGTGGTHGQSITSAIFNDYSNDDFTLAASTDDGIDLSVQGWWDDTNDSWLGVIDQDFDMYGNSRTNWDRGYAEYDIGDTTPPVVTGYDPAKSETGVAKDTNIEFIVYDATNDVDLDSIRMSEESNYHCCSDMVGTCPGSGTKDLTCTDYSVLGDGYTVVYNPGVDYSYDQVVNVTIDADDTEANSMTQDVYSFTIESEPQAASAILKGSGNAWRFNGKKWTLE